MSFFNLPFSVRIAGADPIDGDRYLQPDIPGRDALIGSGREFVGLQVYVIATQQLFVLDQVGPAVWREIGTGGGGGGAISVVANYASLPGSPVAGDAAHVLDAADAPETSIAGKNVWAFYIYDGTAWVLHASELDVQYESEIANGTLTPSAVGGIPAGTDVATLRGLSFTELFDLLLFPTVEASVSAPKSATLDSSLGAVTVEVGSSLDPILTATFAQGSIQNGDGSAGPALVGLPNQYEFTGPGITGSVIVASSNLSEAIDTGNPNFSPIGAALGTNQWDVTISHDAGSGSYTDSKGNPGTNLDPQRVAGDALDGSQIVNGRYNAFYDAGSTAPVDSAGVRAGTSQFLSAANTGTFDIVIPASTPDVWFSVPAGATVLVEYVESSNADVTGSFTLNTFNVADGGGNATSYDNYGTVIGGGGFPATATYRVTVS